jgi:hypothetical protein
MMKVHDGQGVVGYYVGHPPANTGQIEVTLHNGKVQILEVLKSKDSERLFAKTIDPALWVHAAFALKGELND